MKNQDKQVLKVPGTVIEVKTTEDRCVAMKIDTQEINYEIAAKLLMLKGQLGWFVFSISQLDPEDTDNLPKLRVEKGRKTPSERLRAVLFVRWNQAKIKEDFELYYERSINLIIDQVKSKLN
jgi:hypothetical protein